jgi:hypothetical protein
MTKSDQCQRARLTKRKSCEYWRALYTQGLRRLKFQSHNEGKPARAAVLGLPQAPSHNSVSKLSKRFGVQQAFGIAPT